MEKRGDIYKYLLENKNSLIELAKKFASYNNANIDSERIISFLLQIETLEKIKFFIALLNKIIYLNQSEITELIEEAYKKASINNKSVKFFPLGSVQDSSAVACYRFFKTLFDEEKEILNKCCEFSTIADELEKGDVSEFVFIDDNITSGTQVKTFFEELFNEITEDKREMVKKPLSKSQIENLKKIKIKILYAVKLSNKSDKIIEEIKAKYNIQLEIFYGKEDNNDYLLELENSIERGNVNVFKRWISEISVGLFENKEYLPEKLNDRLIGYGNLAKLTVFSHNTPKSLITPLWRTGKYRNLDWIPLFPEFNESKIIKTNSLEFHPLNKELSYLIINGRPIEPLPKLETYIFPDTIKIPSRNCIKNIMKDFRKYITKEPNSILNKSNELQDLLNSVYPLKYDEIKYKQYLTDVDNINIDLEKYYDSIEEYLLVLSSINELRFQIYNVGDDDARSVTWKTQFHSAEYILTKNNKIEIEEPIFSKWIPKISDYKDEVRIVKVKPNLGFLSNIDNFIIKPEVFNLNAYYDLNIFNEIEIIVMGNEKNTTFNIFITDNTLDKIKIPYNLLYIKRVNEEFGSNELIIERIDSVNKEKEKEIVKIMEKFSIPDVHENKSKYLNL